MKYRKLGETDIEVSAVAMGCWALAGGRVWGPQDDDDSITTVRAALDAGVNFFDTAEGYGGGDSELVLGRALAGRRHEAVIATKISRSHLSADGVQWACERSLQRLRTDYIDLYQIHWPSRTVPPDETMEALEGLREQGKVRAIGVCNFGVEDLSDLLEVGGGRCATLHSGGSRCATLHTVWVETNQLPYNLLWRAIEYEILPRCIAEDVGVLCYSPLAQGLLTGKFSSPDEVPEGRARTRHFSGDRPQSRHGEAGCEAETFAAIEEIRRFSDRVGEPMAKVAVAWLLHQAGVTSVLAGARRPEQIEQTAQAADLEFSSDVVAELTRATDEVKRLLGPNPDMWQSDSRFR